MYISVTKIVFKLSMIALRMSKIGHKLVKIVSHVSLNVNICHEDCAEIVDDCASITEDWP